MNILGLDTTGGVASCAVINEEITIGEFTTNYKMNHSKTILPLISSLLQTIYMELSDIDYIACSSGPGSFTGLRIGAATAKALAHGGNKEIVPVPTLDALAYNILDDSRLIVPVMDARRNQVYTALYKNQGGKQIRLTDFMAEDFNVVMEKVNEYSSGKEAIFLGDGITVHKDLIQANGHITAWPNNNMQRAASAAMCAFDLIKEGKAVNYDKFELLYLRKPQAEREYEEKQQNDRNS